MKGTVYKRGSTWTYQVTLGSQRTGRKHHSKGGFRTKKECEAALSTLLTELGKGDRSGLRRRSDLTVGEWLDKWLKMCRIRAKRPLKSSTIRGYKSIISQRIVPHIGDIALVDLDETHLLDLYATLQDGGGQDGRPLAPKSILETHSLLRKALADAVAFKELRMSPVDEIPKDHRPTHSGIKRSDAHWEADEVRSFLERTAGDRLWILWALGFDSGARRGELAALRWGKLDLENRVVTIDVERVVGEGGKVVEDTPKSATSIRDIEIEERTAAGLRRWKAAQARERLAAGTMWEGGTDPHLFANELGVPVRPETLSEWFIRAQDELELPRISFHGMRHTSGSILLAAGEQLHVVSARLGHASIAITGDIYAHVLKGQRTDAARRIGEAIYGPLEVVR